jgi:hypothetical protein
MISVMEIYQNIKNLYYSNLNLSVKWESIADTIVLHREEFRKIKKEIENSKMEMKLDYEISLEKLEKDIEIESDPVVKLSYFILFLHHVIYSLMSSEENYRFSLNGKEEMTILNKNIIYYISLYDKKERNKLFHSFIILFGLESLFNKHLYVGIDYEFTKKKIQLAQLNFEHDVSLKSFILIISPEDLTNDQMQDFIYFIICNTDIQKILHGSDSLDIPYMYTQMLADDTEKIIKFTRSMIDTRFLCEYYKLSRSENLDNRCSIYDQDSSRSAIFFFGVISEKQQERLSEIIQSMPIHYDLDWRISTLSQSQILYAQYDVIFLKYFYYRIINVATKDASTELEKKNIIELYKNLLTEIIQFIYLENNKITFLREKCKEEVDPVNNYFIRNKQGIVKLVDIFNNVSTGIKCTTPKIDIDNLLKVPHFKTTVVIIMKRIVYGIISKNCKVYKNKTTLWIEKLNNLFIHNFFMEMKFNCLDKMFSNISSILQDRIEVFCS